MRLVQLGHATWLVEAGQLRLLCDPVLGPGHSGGTFSFVPRRRIDARDLRADFVFVSHAHPDHFDPESLAALAKADADSIVVTPDAIVAEVARLVGFRSVRSVPPGTRIELDGDLVVMTTPSRAPEVEWGVLALDRSASVWNMIDTVFEGPAEVRRIRDATTAGRRVDLALAPVQPMREVALATAGWVGFDFRQYEHMLACATAVDAAHLVPSAAGDVHAPPFDAMTAWVQPVSRDRAGRDVERLAPATRVLYPRVGEALVVEGGTVGIEPGGVPLEMLGDAAVRAFRPLEAAPLVDPNLLGLPEQTYRDRIRRWLADDLAPALARSLAEREDLAAVRLSLEVVYPDAREGVTFDRHGRMRDGVDDEYEVLNIAAASMLYEVIEGRRGWGEPLLAGLLRSSVRGIAVVGGVARHLSIAPMFLYYALPYLESARRAALHRAREAVAS